MSSRARRLQHLIGLLFVAITSPAWRYDWSVSEPALFPGVEWLCHHRAALSGMPNEHLGYPGPLGALEVRDALAKYLACIRGVAAAPEGTVMCRGLTQAIVLVCRALRARGIDAIAVEDPGFGLHRQAISKLAAAARRALTTPDQDRADTILASTQAATLPAADLAATLPAATPRPAATTSTDTAGASAKLPAV